MLSLGIDIGTTSISTVIMDEQNRLLESRTLIHGASVPGSRPWERMQDASILVERALALVNELGNRYALKHIGITGQQHGIVYLDGEGRIISPLYTWQDRRAGLPFRGSDYVTWLSEKSGKNIYSGYGLASHFYNLINGLVPDSASSLATVSDLLLMRLCGMERPVLDPSQAHSLGFFDLETLDFDREALCGCGIDPSILPDICRKAHFRASGSDISVSASIGDNQAGFIGAAPCDGEAVLLNIGTGGQISFRNERPIELPSLESRPFPLGGFLISGASLCGGKAWALTENFFRAAVRELTGADTPMYSALERLLDRTVDDGSHPKIRTSFDGSRTAPLQSAAVDELRQDNFNPGQFALGILHGMADELYDLYAAYLNAGFPAKKMLYGSGNGLRMNRHLQRICADTFGMDLNMAENTEEAASGAAIFCRSIS